MNDGRLDRRLDLDGTVVEVERLDGQLVVTRRSADGVAERFDPAQDTVLPALGTLLDPRRRDHLVSRLLGTDTTVQDSSLVRYRAGRRATVRVVIAGLDGTSVEIFAKVFHDPVKAATTAASLAHLSAHADPDADLRLPKLLGHDPASACLCLEALAGARVVLARDDERSATAAEFRRFGRAVAELHDLPRGVLPDRPTPSRLIATRARVHQLGSGPLASLAARALDEIEAWFAGADRGDEVDRTVVHGDCKPDQVLIGAHLALLDPDHLGWGDPAGDVADVHVALRQHVIRELVRDARSVDPDALLELAVAFDAGYVECRPSAAIGTFADRVGQLERLSLLRKALRAEARSPGSELSHRLVTAALPS